ncbi:Ribonuclease H-like superfamily [Arabidopsis thaliana x Arabidopsis arenosa]|uniref:Ribonuclease H-like superfamily n=1 Tax=Arabidopsis thaliana x Arabidopsis arenosa TaxID=1240361 RepID=A0A8T1ZMV9_9BRAS|nr:Ribonuclease H-like superfamily [Arabidopsis thaliana x Arabidopsis arenosa]
MSTIKLPASTLCKLDKAARDFIWGSSGEGRKLHLVSWKNVCLPKKDGGLGIRTACEMNKALLAKLGWRLLHEKTSLWVRVVSCKYKVGDLQDVAWTKAKSNWSSTWRSVGIGLREVIYKGYGWAIGDGKSVNFWSDRWLLETPIMDTVIEPLPAENAIVKARDLWRNGSGWDWEKIMPYISENRRLELAAVVLDTVTGAKDRLSWAATTNGKFTVKSAYELITRDEYPRQHMDKFYERLWKVIAPERVRVFLWLVGKQVVMTNEERFRRHLCDTEICQICKNGVESIIHVLRDCPAMAGIWIRIVPLRRRHEFFSMSLIEWLYVNLGGGGGEEGESWPTMFAMAVWWGWKWRCGNIFGDNRVWKDRVRFIKELAKEVMAAKVLNGNGVTKAVRVEKMIKWVTPPTGWFKLNTDGASHGNPGLATAGGVLRNEAGEWCGGFALNIGRCSAPLAELWGVYYGLYIAWEQRITRLELEVDYVMVVEFLTTGIGDSHPLSFLSLNPLVCENRMFWAFGLQRKISGWKMAGPPWDNLMLISGEKNFVGYLGMLELNRVHVIRELPFDHLQTAFNPIERLVWKDFKWQMEWIQETLRRTLRRTPVGLAKYAVLMAKALKISPCISNTNFM